MKISDFEIQDHAKLDEILVDLCELVIRGQQNSQDLGVVAAAVLDPAGNCVFGINHPSQGGRRVHAERAAVNNYVDKFGSIPSGCVVVTTLNPCAHDMAEREGDSCTDLMTQHNIHKVYCGFKDPEQIVDHKTFHLQTTGNKKIQALCKAFADTFLKEQLDELKFLGSPCTKDCSGHRAGYDWSKARGGVPGNSPYSPSFNKGAQLARDGK